MSEAGKTQAAGPLMTRRAAVVGLSLSVLSRAVRAAGTANALYPDEELLEGAGVASIARFRPGAADKPLVLFIPGGGHLARIAYGHPGSRPSDFLLPQLEQRGYSTLALSYPSSHPAFRQARPDLGILDWSRAIAAITAERVRRSAHRGDVVAIGWSLGGRVARNLAREAPEAGFRLAGFIGLSAAGPMPGLGTLRPEQIALSAEGLWDSSSARSFVAKSRGRQMDVVDALNGRIVIPRDVYFSEYLCDTPLSLRGEAHRYRSGQLTLDVADAVSDQGSFDFAGYPLTGAIAAGDQTDPRWSLTSTATWAFFNAQSLYFNEIAPRIAKGTPIAEADWLALQRLIDALPQRLSRRVSGSHMFFVGELGARQTARYVEELILDIARIRAELKDLLRA